MSKSNEPMPEAVVPEGEHAWWARNPIIAHDIAMAGVQKAADATGVTQRVNLWDPEAESWVIYADIEPNPRRSRAVNG